VDKARRTSLSAALFVLICFFLPWVQVSCIGMKDSASGFDLARGGDRAFWLLPVLMILVLTLGLARPIWDRLPALFALGGMAGGLICAWLMYYERNHARPASSLTSTFWTTWYWLGLLASLVVSGAALWFYASRSRAP
jgi:hypothetical protein